MWALRRSRAISLLVAVVAAVTVGLVFHGWIKTDATSCNAMAEAPVFSTRPGMLFGISFGFESRVLAAFPVGSCEADLVDWLKGKDFRYDGRSAMETGFTDEPDEFSRYFARSANGTTINVYGKSQKAPIGRSYFFVAWNADAAGRLTEVRADTELFQFDLP